MNVEEEIDRLREEIQRLGKIQADGSYKVNINPNSIHSFIFISMVFTRCIASVLWFLSLLLVNECSGMSCDLHLWIWINTAIYIANLNASVEYHFCASFSYFFLFICSELSGIIYYVAVNTQLCFLCLVFTSFHGSIIWLVHSGWSTNVVFGWGEYFWRNGMKFEICYGQ